jgi:hypothetical protein
MTRAPQKSIARPANLFRLLSEFTLLLLGGLLVLLSLTRPERLPRYPSALIFVGILFVYWGVRAWIKPEEDTPGPHTHIRAGSLALVGALTLAIPLSPRQDVNWLLGVVGGILVLRGLLGGALFVRSS